MTNEQLTEKMLEVLEHQAKQEGELVQVINELQEVKEEVGNTKSLAEDVHIMAINMSNMQKTLEKTNVKVEELTQKDYNNYKDNKKLVKNTIVSGVTGAAVTFILGLAGILIKMIMNGGQ